MTRQRAAPVESEITVTHQKAAVVESEVGLPLILHRSVM